MQDLRVVGVVGVIIKYNKNPQPTFHVAASINLDYAHKLRKLFNFSPLLRLSFVTLTSAD